MKEYNGHLFAALSLALFITAGCAGQQHLDPKSALGVARAHTLSSFDRPVSGEKVTPAQMIKFEQADLAQVLSLYTEISHRSIILAGNLPDVKITFSNQTPMTAVEVLQALDTVLAAQDIAMVCLGTQYVKAVPASAATQEPGPIIELDPDQLPESSSFLIYIVRLNKVAASRVVPALQPFAKLPNSIIAIGLGNDGPPLLRTGLPKSPAITGSNAHSILILRDYSSNVRRMLQVLEKVEQQEPLKSSSNKSHG
jgi:type II secretory pathway component GspD/PulD (secretin)